MQAGLCLAPLELALNLKVWRISKPGHGKASPNGTGAHRWNSPGTPIIYAAESRALAVLEMLCHLEGRELLNPYVLIEIGIEESLIRNVARSSLPENWRFDPSPQELKRIGDEWIRKAECPVLRVPSALLPDEHNFLLNTEHRDFHRLNFGEPVPFRFDSSLIKTANQ
jgi:RES domain-containing protein